MGIAAAQIVLDKGQEDDWLASTFILTLTVVCIMALVLFLFWELAIPNPVVQLRIFKERTYATGVLLMTIVGFVLYGSMVLLPIFLQSLLGYPAVKAGIAMFPRGLGSFLMMPLTGVLVSRFDARKLLAIGVVGAAFSMWQLAGINLNAGFWRSFGRSSCKGSRCPSCSCR